MMFKNPISYFKQPYPFGGNWGQKIRQNAAIGAFVAIFLIAFQPFGASLWHTPYKTLFMLGYGLVSFIGPSLVHGVIFGRMGYENAEKKWTVGREIAQYIAILIVIALGNMVYSNLIGIAQISLSALIVWVGIVALVAVFPIMAGVLLRYERYAAMNKKTAAVMEDRLKQYRQEESSPFSTLPDELSFYAENEKDVLKIDAFGLLFIESADNYASFVFLKNGEVQKQLLRGALKRFEDQIGDHPHILRCHRSFIVNLKLVEHVVGNAQGYRLTLRRQQMEVPVARNYGPAVLARLKELST